MSKKNSWRDRAKEVRRKFNNKYQRNYSVELDARDRQITVNSGYKGLVRDFITQVNEAYDDQKGSKTKFKENLMQLADKLMSSPRVASEFFTLLRPDFYDEYHNIKLGIKDEYASLSNEDLLEKVSEGYSALQKSVLENLGQDRESFIAGANKIYEEALTKVSKEDKEKKNKKRTMED